MECLESGGGNIDSHKLRDGGSAKLLHSSHPSSSQSRGDGELFIANYSNTSVESFIVFCQVIITIEYLYGKGQTSQQAILPSTLTAANDKHLHCAW